MNEEGNFLPLEVKRFFIAERHFKEILEDRFGGDIELVEIDDGEVAITVSTSFLEEILGDRYNRKVESVEFDGEEVDIEVSESLEETKGENPEGLRFPP